MKATKFLVILHIKSFYASQGRDKGITMLGDRVMNENDRLQAESLAESFAGTEVVADQIAVIPVGRKKEVRAMNSDLDDGIGSNLDAVLIQYKMRNFVKYKVKSGVVTLTCEVNSNYLRMGAERVAAMVPNLQQGVNDQQVKNQKASSVQ